MADQADQNAHESLLAAGYTHRRAANGLTTGKHDIFDAGGEVVASLRAHEVHGWLAKRKIA